MFLFVTDTFMLVSADGFRQDLKAWQVKLSWWWVRPAGVWDLSSVPLVSRISWETKKLPSDCLVRW